MLTRKSLRTKVSNNEAKASNNEKGVEMNNANRDKLILQWQESQRVLAEAKNAEAELRKQVLSFNFSFNPDALREGTENLELGNGYKLKAVFKASRGFVTGPTQADLVEKALSKIEKFGEEGKFIAECLVKWKPELSKTEYDKLEPKFRKIIDEVVVTKPASPSLELVTPKDKK